MLTFALCTVASVKFRTPYLIPTLIAVVPLPLVFGLIGFYPDFEALYASWQVIMLADATPQAAELAEAGMFAMTPVFLGLVLSLPSYVLSIVVLCYRAFRHSESTQGASKAPPLSQRTLDR